MVAAVAVLLFVLSGGLNMFKKARPVVVRTVPDNGVAGVGDDSNITVVFLNNLPVKEREKLSISIDPPVGLKQDWISEKNLVLIPSPALEPDTNYTVSLFFNSSTLHELSFRTSPPIQERVVPPIERQIDDTQTYVDPIYEIHTQKPWLMSLPIKTDTHTIVYDFDKESIRIRLHIPESSPEDQKEAAKQKALEDLYKAEVDTDAIPYHFLYQD